MCDRCGGSGWIWIDKTTVKECACAKAEKSRRILEKSGLADVVESKTFSSFVRQTEAQRASYKAAVAWTDGIINKGSKSWLLMGGAVGSGKTHLCTAACGALLKHEIPVRYMLWTVESRKLRSVVNDFDEYYEALYPLQTVRVLYIDDLFKTRRGAGIGTITDAEVKVAFDLIDARYRNNLPTIISTEWSIEDLLDIDEGTFSRVAQMCGRDNVIMIDELGTANNYRLKEWRSNNHV